MYAEINRNKNRNENTSTGARSFFHQPFIPLNPDVKVAFPVRLQRLSNTSICFMLRLFCSFQLLMAVMITTKRQELSRIPSYLQFWNT